MGNTMGNALIIVGGIIILVCTIRLNKKYKR